MTHETYDYSRARNLNLTAGLSLGFDASVHVEIAVEGTANRITTAANSAPAKQVMFGVGVHYHFNIGKRAK